MKLLRRNDNSYNRGSISHGEEMKHMRALSLIEELNERTRKETRQDESERDESDRRQGLDPKRLLCFSNKAKKDKNGETNRKKSPWRTRGMGEFDRGKTSSVEKERRNNGDLSDLCNELCQDYYEIRKKLRNRPIVLTTKKAQILEVLAGSTSTSSSVDAPLRNFDQKISKRRENKKTESGNEAIELRRRQRSLLDDNASVHSENNKSNGISIFTMNSKSKRYSRKKSGGKNSEKSDRSNRSKPRSERSSRGKSNRDRSNRLRYAPPDIANSQSTEQTAPVSVIERKVRSGLHADSSVISTITSKSYTTSGETDVIWSPRGAKEKVNKSSRASQKPKTKNLGLQVCAASPCAGQSQRNLVTRNPDNVGTSSSNLQIIREGDDFSSSSDSSASMSSYGSSSSGSYSGSSYSDTGSEDEGDDLRIVYSSSYTKKSKSKKTKSVSSGCTTLAKEEIWNAIMYDDGNSIEERDDN